MVNDSYYMVIIWLMMVNNNNNVGGWALPLWKMMEFVSWDDDIPNVWENKMHVPNHQPGFINHLFSWFYKSYIFMVL